MSVRCLIIDAFTDEVFGGNPAGVVVLGAPAPESWMQKVAAELRHSESAFLWPEADNDTWRLRWFTPTTEIKLCGHGTVAATWALRELSMCREGEDVGFETLSGRLLARATPTGAQIDLPTRPVVPAEVPREEIERAIGHARFVGVGRIEGGESDWLVRCESAAEVASLVVDSNALAPLGRRGLVVTAPGEPASGVDFVSRFFAPGLGIAEDPVTGATHCGLGPYWAAELGTSNLVARQLSARGGRLDLEVKTDRVVIGGSAVTVLRGELAAPFADG